MRRVLGLVLATSLCALHAAGASAPDQRVKELVRLADEGKLDEADQALVRLLTAEPNNPAYLTAREELRQRRAANLIQNGDLLLGLGNRVAAQAEFAKAYALDPQNAYARQRFQDAKGEKLPAVEVVQFDSLPTLAPKPGRRALEYRGDGRGLIELFAREFGLKANFDPSFSARPVRVTLPNATFDEASDAVRGVTKSFFVTLSHNEFLVSEESTENHRRLDRFALRTFYVPDAANPQDLIEVVNVLRMMFDLRQIMANQATSTVTVRAPGYALDAAQQLLEDLSGGRPEVMIDVQVLQVSESRATDAGVRLPLQFTAFNLNTELRKLVSDPRALDLINQLANGGTISASDAAALAGLVAAAQNSSSPLLQGFATLGGGITRTGVVIPPASVNFKYNASDVRTFQRVTMRAQQGKAATYRIGDRYPVLTGTFSPLVNIPLPASLAQKNNAQPLTPSFNFEDLGITFKATANVSPDGDMRLDFDLALRALSGASFNGVPTISNRQFVGTISVKEGETSVIAGSADENEQKSLQGLPLLSRIPGLRYAVANPVRQRQQSQLLLLVSAHRVRSGRTKEPTELLLPRTGTAQ